MDAERLELARIIATVGMASITLSGQHGIHGSVPASLRVTTVAVLLLVLVLMTGDIVIWAHGGMHWAYLAIVLGSEMLVVGGWLAYEMRSDRYARPPLERPTRWFLHHLRRLPLLFAGFVVCTYGLRYLVFALHGESFGIGSRLFFSLALVVEAVKVTLLYCCWLGLVFGFQSFREMREQNERLLNAQRSLAEAQLTQLRAQLRPHFLFNALNTVSSTMQADVSRADRLLTELGDLLRANLDTTDRNLVTLEQEMRLLRRYADIMLARFGDRVTIDWQVANDALGVSIPSMLLQPLLENAFKHGVERNASAQQIRIRTTLNDDRLHIAIHNSASRLSMPVREGFGTRSCRERLVLLYGDRASFSLRDDGVGGVEAKIEIPVEAAHG